MVGQGVLRECLLDPDVSEVLSVGRSKTGQQHPKLKEVVLKDVADLSSIETQLDDIDACFFCLGVSSVGMSEADYTRLTHDLTVSVATTVARRTSHTAPRTTFIYVSGAGTDGRAMWARVKRKTEIALTQLPFKQAIAFRPAYIQPMHGIRSKTAWYNAVYAVMGWMYPLLRLATKYVTTTEQMGKAMIAVAKHGAAKPILENADINAAA